MPRRLFEGKAAKYNTLVLEALLSGERTTKELASYISVKTWVPPIPGTKKNPKHLYSVISRKNATLDRLSNWSFIERNDKLQWYLTVKGLAVALTQIKDLEDVYPILKENLEKSPLKESFKMLSQVVNRKYAREVEHFAYSLRFWKIVKSKTKELLERGVDVEGMSKREFRDLISVKAFSPFINEIARKHISRSHRRRLKSALKLLDYGV